MKATTFSAKQAYKMAEVEPKDIDVAEVHDCFTIAEIMAYEDLNFCNKGEGGKFIEEGRPLIGGEIPVNTSGGLKAKGHPIGATGIGQVNEIVNQLRGKTIKNSRQVLGAEVGLTHNVGGDGATAVVCVFKR
jgi:acetyl-CoA acetyltransferase